MPAHLALCLLALAAHLPNEPSPGIAQASGLFGPARAPGASGFPPQSTILRGRPRGGNNGDVGSERLAPSLVHPSHARAGTGDGAIATEWAVRRRALDPARHADELRTALASSTWELRHAALDALARALPWEVPSPLADEVRALLTDEHPNVRRMALRAATRLERRVPDETLAALACDPFWGTRAEVARILGLDPTEHDGVLLEGLAADPDPRVASVAFDLLFGRGPTALDAQLALWERADLDRSPQAFLRAAECVARGAGNAPLIERVRSRLATGEPSAASAARRALWEAASVASLGEVREQTWVNGFLSPLPDAGGSVERRRRALLVEGARAVGEELAEGLLAAARAFDAAASGRADLGAVRALLAPWPNLAALAGGDPSDDLARAIELVEAAVEVTGGTSASTSLLETLASCSTPTSVAGWNALLARRDRWDPFEVAGFLAVERDAELCLAVIDVLSETLSRTGDGGAARLLTGALDDLRPEVAESAFRALCEHLAPGEGLDDLHRFWSALGDGRDLQALRFLPRTAPPRPFREDFLQLWETGRFRKASLLELLGLFSGDGEIGARLAGWIEEELPQLSLADRPPREVKRGPWREREDRIKALAAALHKVEGEAAVEYLEGLLERTDALSSEVAKTCAWALGRTALGRGRLGRWLADGVSQRVRIESALALASDGARGPTDVLLERYEHCDEELRLRILRRLGGLPAVRCVEHLAAVVLEPGHSAAERVVALGEVAAHADPARAVAALTEVVERTPDADLERAAIEALGATGSAGAGPILRAALVDGRRAALLRDELLPALSAIPTAAAGEALARELWRSALANAPEELAARFRGRSLPAREFVYRGELRAVAGLARDGRLLALLEGGVPWWRMDARLAAELAVLALEAPVASSREAGRRLLRGAVAGLVGEAPSAEGEHRLCRARAGLLALALGARRHAAAAFWSGELLDAWRAGRTSARAFTDVFGLPDPRRGVDPLARLEATRHQGHAWLALERGDRPAARELTRRAALPARASRRAAAEQVRLERAVGDS